MSTKTDIKFDNTITLRSVYGKVNMKYYIQPCKDPITGRFPECVKHVNSQGDIIMTDAERNSGKYFVKEDEVFIIEDGKTFNLDDEIDAAQWEAIKHCKLIAPDRYAKDDKGVSLIDGESSWNNKKPRYGVAELYVERIGADTQRKISRKVLQHKAISFILDDERGYDGRVMKAKLLGKNMTNFTDADVQDFLIEIAEKNPDKIINLYTGGDTRLRLLFIEAREKHVILYKNKLFIYGDDIVLGATDDAVITWMSDPRNKKVLDLITKETYPELQVSKKDKEESKKESKN